MNKTPKYVGIRFMQKTAVIACTILLASTLIAQEETEQVNTVLDIDALYTPCLLYTSDAADE